YFKNNLLEYDALSDKLFIGNNVIDRDKYTSATLVKGMRFVGYKKDKSALYTIDIDASLYIHIYKLDPGYNLRSDTKLFQLEVTGEPVFLYNQSENELFIAEWSF